MPVKVRCSGCKKVLNAPEKARGKAIRCPGCETRVRVPTAAQQAAKKKKAASAPQAVDATGFLGDLDLNDIEDTSVRICQKCGTEVGEEDVDCPACGIDLRTGVMSAATKEKLARKGPDPAKFYKEAPQSAWRFLFDNKHLVVQTSLFVLMFSLASLGCGYMVLWCSGTPPKVFWGFVGILSLMVPPGWTWFLCTEIIRATLEKQKKIKKVNADFFLNSSLGIKVFLWTFVISLPLQLAAAYFLDQGNQQAALIFAGSGVLLAFVLLPIVMVHMSMPVTYPGWLVHKMFVLFFKHAVATLYWCVLAVATMAPVFGLVATIGAFYQRDLGTLVGTLKYNALIAAAKAYETPRDKETPPEIEVLQDEELAYVDGTVLIVPGILWIVSCLFYGPAVVFNMRSNGVFAHYFKLSLDLISLKKEIVWVQKETDDEAEQGQLTGKKVAFGIQIAVAFGFGSGGIYGNLAGDGFLSGIGLGLCGSGTLLTFVSFVIIAIAALKKNPLKWPCLLSAGGIVIVIVGIVLELTMGLGILMGLGSVTAAG